MQVFWTVRNPIGQSVELSSSHAIRISLISQFTCSLLDSARFAVNREQIRPPKLDSGDERYGKLTANITLQDLRGAEEQEYVHHLNCYFQCTFGC